MLQIHFRSILRGHPPPCHRYEKLTNDGSKVARRPTSRWVKKMSGGLKGLRLSRSRKLSLSLKTFSMARMYADIADGMKMTGLLCPMTMNVIFSTHWGLPTLSHPSLQYRRKNLVSLDTNLTCF